MDYSLLARLASGHVEARIIQVAVAMKLFDALDGGGCSASSLALSLATDVRATELLLNALVSFGLLDKHDQFFTLNDVSTEYLVTSSPKYYGHMILFDASLWGSWGELEQAVRRGAPVRTPDMYQGDRRETERFILGMDSLVKARGDAEVVADNMNISGVQEMLDLGPGPASYAIQWCMKFAQLRATLFDLPETLKMTDKFVKEAGVGNQIQLIKGDYRHDPIPGTYQMIFLSNIIHSEGEEENRRLMSKLYTCLDAGGRIVIKDHILDSARTGPPVGAAFALLMLLTTELGRCYSSEEVQGWLQAAGFVSTDHIALPDPLTSSLVIGYKY